MSLFYSLMLLLFVSACGEISFGDEGTEDESTGQTVSDGTNFELPANVVDSYSYINFLRQSAGMTGLEQDAQLQVAAQGHTQYLATNDVVSHTQSQGLPDFTGEYPSDRAVAAGFHTISVSEGIANGRTEFRAMDNLMSAIYHRFTLLDVRNDRIGMYFEKITSDQGLLVHNMSNDALNALCETPFNGAPAVSNICSPDIIISDNALRAAWSDVSQRNPEMIVWPPENGEDIPPAFFEETPDPLVDYSVSGYPISVQFNTEKVASVTVNEFRLFDVDADEYVDNVRLMDRNTDPNDIFDASGFTFDFALFPLERLRWARQYRVELAYLQDGVLKSKQWQFKTRGFKHRVVRVEQSDTSVTIENNTSTYLYFVPANGQDVITRFSTVHLPSTELTLGYEDQNTIKISASGNTKDALSITLNNSRTINVVLE